MAWIGAVAGAAASAYGAKQSNKAGKNAGKVDVYHETIPYGDSGWYKDQIAQRAYESLFGQSPAPGVGSVGPQNPSHMPPGGPGLRERPSPDEGGIPDQYGRIANSPATAAGGGKKGGRGKGGIPDQYGRIANSPATAAGGGKKGGRGKGGKGGGAKGATKTPGTTQQAIDNAMRVAGEMEKSPTVTAAQDYTAGTLKGEDQNPYRAETAGMLRNINDTEHAANYNRLLDSLWGSDTGVGGGRSSKGGGNVRYGYAGGSAPGSGAVIPANQAKGPIGVASDIRSLLDGNDSPAMKAMQEKIARQGGEALAEQQKALRLRAAGSGNYGGSGQDYAEGTALSKYGGYIADANAQMYSDLYGQALGLGTQYDMGALDRAAQERAANASASAAGGAQAAAIASQERMQRLGLLAELTGTGLDMDKFQASGFGSLGEGFSGDQRNALSLAGDVNGMGQSGWLNAGQLSLGRDQTQNQLRASLAGTGVQRQALEFDKYKYNREAPLRDLTQFGGLISGLYDPYATTHDFGFDARSQSPSYSNPVLQGLSGAAAGYQLGSDMAGRR